MSTKQKKLKAYTDQKKDLKSNSFSVDEAYRIARTNIDFSIISEGCKTILITSPNASDGKSTTAVNIAQAFAKQIDKKTLLIDCDLRKPRVGNYLGIKSNMGLTEFLCKNVKIDSIIQKTETSNLYVICSGEIPPNPSELLLSNRMQKILVALKQNFDYIIIDSPPVNVVVDTVSVAKHCDGVVCVVRERKSTYKDIDAMLETIKLANVKLLGFVLNDSTGKWKSSYKYKNFYKNYGYYG